MEKLVQINNNIDNILSKITNEKVHHLIQLPTILVVGSQSVGKSSVLEAILGCSFLPRGQGIVTRRPIEIQLTQIHTNEEYFEFDDLKGQKFTDPNQVRETIQRLTDKVAGPKGIKDTKLSLKFFSPNVLDMTLIDLPGLVKNALPDQPIDIDKKVRAIAESYLKNENCLILAISKGTDDLANSEAIKIAKEFNPTEERIFSVITHIDLLEQGRDISNALLNKELPLKNGHIGFFLQFKKFNIYFRCDVQRCW